MAFLVAVFMASSPASAIKLNPVKSGEAVAGTTITPEHLVKVKGCHGAVKKHWVKKWGLNAWHYHGYNCKPIAVKKKKHCHRGWKKHWHKNRGNKWHKHKGKSCWYKKGKAGYKKYGGQGCIKFGNFWICG